MNMTCPVVTIVTDNGPVEINECDYDSKVHKLYKAPAKKAAPKKAAKK